MPDDNLYPKDFPHLARLKVEIARDEASERLATYLAMKPPVGFTEHRSDYCAFLEYIFDVVLAFGQAACGLGRDPISQEKWPAYRIRTDVDKFLWEWACKVYDEKGRDRHGQKFRSFFEYSRGADALEWLKSQFRNSEQGHQYEAERQAVARHQAQEILKPAEDPDAPAPAPVEISSESTAPGEQETPALDPLSAEKAARRRLLAEYKAECKRLDIRMTYESITRAANPGWKSRTQIDKWLACTYVGEYDREVDRRIRKHLTSEIERLKKIRL
jgi:hypothetical protein